MTLHRTQVLLEPWQHEALKARAARHGASLSGELRTILDEALRARAGAVDDLLGAFAGPGDGRSAARDHDDLLYGM